MDPGSGSVDEVDVELYVRSLSPPDSRTRIESIVSRLEDLVQDDTISRFRVLPTGSELPATPADAVTDYGAYLLGRIAVFQEWATATGRSVDSLFDRRTVSSSFTGEEHDTISLPTVLMAEYEGSALRFVSPCSEGDEYLTVLERLEDLAAEGTVTQDERLSRAKSTNSFEPSTKGI